jgi:hypothetical protein
MLLRNALRPLLSMTVRTIGATRAGPFLEIKALPTALAAHAPSSVFAALAATREIGTILDNPAGRRLGSLEITGIFAVLVKPDLVTNNMRDFLPSTPGLLDCLAYTPHSSLNGSVQLRRAALGNQRGATFKLMHNGIGVNPCMQVKAIIKNRKNTLQIVSDRPRNTRLDWNDGRLLQSSTRGIELSGVVEAKTTKHGEHEGHEVLRVS